MSQVVSNFWVYRPTFRDIVEKREGMESSLQLNVVFLNIFLFFFTFRCFPFLYSLNIMLSKNRKNEKRMIAALMKCENSYVRYREMEGFQVAKNDMESRSKYSV